MTEKTELFRFVQLRSAATTALPQPSPAPDDAPPDTTPQVPDPLGDAAASVINVSSDQIDTLRKSGEFANLGPAAILKQARQFEKQLAPFVRATRHLRKNGAEELGQMRELTRQGAAKLGMDALAALEHRVGLTIAAAEVATSSTTAYAVLEDVVRGVVIARALLDDATTAETVISMAQAQVQVIEHPSGDLPPLRYEGATVVSSMISAITADLEIDEDELDEKAISRIGLDQSRTPIRDVGIRGPINPLFPRGSDLVARREGPLRLVSWAGGYLTKESQPDTTWTSGGAGIPSSIGGVRKMSVGDLYVATIEDVQYDWGDIAHVENVMQTEHRSRRYSVTETEESYDESETTEYERSTKSLQTTENTELQQAVDIVVASSTDISAGFGMTASYGPVSASADFGMDSSTSRSMSKKQATSFAREVLEKSSKEVAKSVRRLRTMRRTVTVEDENTHGFDNRLGNGHVVGVYRFLDKVVTSRVKNYGARLMLEFVVPEPAAVLAHVMGEAGAARSGIDVPHPFSEMPEDITEENYQALAALHGVQNVPAPPPFLQTLAHAAPIRPADTADYADPERNRDPDLDASDPETGYFTGGHKFECPEGYHAVSLTASAATTGRVLNGESNVSVRCVIGAHELFLSDRISDASKSWDPITKTVSLRGKKSEVRTYPEGEVTVTWAGRQDHGTGLNFLLRCRRRPEALEAWRMQTWSIINDAHQSAQRAYDNRVAHNAAVNADFGTNPARLREIERAELKRSALSLLTDQDFSQFGATEFLSNGDVGDYPRLDTAEAQLEAGYIRFFEDSMDWTNISQQYYDYSWAGRHRWHHLMTRNSTDPQHRAFLQAGAARIVVPVQPGYEIAVLKYLENGTLWDGETELSLGDEHPLSDEIAAMTALEEADIIADEGVLETVRVPTDLVILQQSPDPNAASGFIEEVETPSLPPS